MAYSRTFFNAKKTDLRLPGKSGIKGSRDCCPEHERLRYIPVAQRGDLRERICESHKGRFVFTLTVAPRQLKTALLCLAPQARSKGKQYEKKKARSCTFSIYSGCYSGCVRTVSPLYIGDCKSHAGNQWIESKYS